MTSTRISKIHLEFLSMYKSRDSTILLYAFFFFYIISTKVVTFVNS